MKRVKSLITTTAILLSGLSAVAQASAPVVDLKPIQLDAYIIASTMKPSDIKEFSKFADSADPMKSSTHYWKSKDKDYELGAPSYKVVAGKHYKTQLGHVCSDLVMVLEHGNSIGYGTGTMCKSNNSWIVLE